MAKTLEQILGSVALTSLVNGIKGGVPDDVIPPEFMRVNRTVTGNTTKYRKVDNTRKVARLVQYGSASVRREQTGVSEVPITLMHTFEHQVFEAWVLQNLRSAMDAEQRLGEDEVARQTAEFKRLFMNLRMASTMSMIAQGKIFFDSNGNMLPSSSSAVTTVDAGVPAGNRNQIGGIISAKWSVAGTDIPVQIANLKKYARKLTGYRPMYAFYGANILSYFTGNDKMKEIINRNPAMQNAVLMNNEIPDGLMGMKWRPIYESFFEDQDGSNQDLADDDTVVFTPDPSPEWWEVIEGTYAIPSNMVLGGNALDVLATLRNVPGMFSYAEVQTDPPSIKQLAGDTFLPIIKVPNAVFIAKVKW